MKLLYSRFNESERNILALVGKTDKPPKTVTISHVEEEYMGSRVFFSNFPK
jgi:hypothetical protein